MGYYLPESGTNLWYDSMVIPANAKNVELAHEFINFVTSYDYAYDNSSYVGYTSPNQEVLDVRPEKAATTKESTRTCPGWDIRRTRYSYSTTTPVRLSVTCGAR